MDPSLLVIAGVHRNRQRTRGDEDDSRLTQYLNQYSASEAERRFAVVNQHIETLREEDISNYGSSASDQERQVNALIERAEKNIEREQNYLKLLWLLTFAVMYCVMLWWQKDVSSHYALESSVHTTIIAQLTNLNGLQFGTAEWADRGSITSQDAFFSWLSNSILQRILTQPLCGDGVCDSPTEFPGFGRFGCIPDCGLYTKTTTITVDFKTFLQSTKNSKTYWDLSNVAVLNDPGFTYNIYSDTMGDYLFANDMSPNQKVLVDAPDGNLTLYLYQTREMSAVIDPTLIYQNLGILYETMPARSATTNFGYADPREVIASSAVILDAINSYCVQGTGPLDNNCFKYPVTDTQIHVMGSYGMSGAITMSDGGRGLTTLVPLAFCSSMPNATAGLQDPANKQHFVKSSTPCPTSRRRLADQGSWVVPRTNQKQLRNVAAKSFQDLVGCDTWQGSGPSCSQIDQGCPAYWNCFCGLGTPDFLCQIQTCNNHSDCLSGSSQFFCSSSQICVPCEFCQVGQDDSVTGQCPQDICPGSGGWPQCVKGTDLTQTVTSASCPSAIPFSIWKYFDPGSEVDVVPNPENRVRMVTPTNMLVGPVTVTQLRSQQGPCNNIMKSSVRAFFNSSDCVLSALNGTPYGVDPTFLSSSSIYNGKLQISDFYNTSEIIPSMTSNVDGVNVTTTPTALGFFPHQYGLSPSQIRPQDLNTFRLYFDGVLTQSQAQAMVAYAQEGGFIDGHTQYVAVDFITFSPTTNKFATVSFSFHWEDGGNIIWDFAISSFAVDLYGGEHGKMQLGLEIVCIILLMISTFYELNTVFQSLRAFELPQYVLKPGNYFHWIHKGLMWHVWICWMRYYQAGVAFKIAPSYDVLANQEGSARFFQVNTTEESEFLAIKDQIDDISAQAVYYGSMSAFCAFLFCFSLLEAFRFQPRLGLISRTLEIVAPDLFNFALLFIAIFGGFCVACTLLFGHQVYKVSLLEKSIVFLMFEMVTLDPTQFWFQFTHAAPAWAFNLWTWSFIFVLGFGLFNVLLALLIEGFERASDESNESKSVPAEIAEIAQQAFFKLFKPSSMHMPDARLRDILLARKAGLPETKYIRSIMLENMNDDDEERSIKLRGGVAVLFRDLKTMLEKSKARTLATTVVAPEASNIDGEYLEARTQSFVDGEVEELNSRRLLNDMIDRYETYFDSADVNEGDILMNIFGLEQLRRNLVVFRGHRMMMDRVSHVGRVISQMGKKMLSTTEYLNFVNKIQKPIDLPKPRNGLVGTLSVIVCGAENLPNMDVLRSIDGYCLLFMSSARVKVLDLAANAGKTKTVMNNPNPVWNEEFEFDVETVDQVLVVTVFDCDTVTSDDFVGCVVIPVADFADGESVTNSYPIARAGMKSWSARQPKVKLQVRFTSSQRAASQLAA